MPWPLMFVGIPTYRRLPSFPSPRDLQMPTGRLSDLAVAEPVARNVE